MSGRKPDSNDFQILGAAHPYKGTDVSVRNADGDVWLSKRELRGRIWKNGYRDFQFQVRDVGGRLLFEGRHRNFQRCLRDSCRYMMHYYQEAIG